MYRLRRTSARVLSVAVFSICGCVSIDKRLSEDLQTDGFTIHHICDEEVAAWPTVTVTDAESAEMVTQWLRHRPRASGHWETELVQNMFTGLPGLFSDTTRIETTRLRVTLPMIADLPVVLETRATPASEWRKASWNARKEDVQLQRWAMAHIAAESIAHIYAEHAAEAVGHDGQAISN